MLPPSPMPGGGAPPVGGMPAPGPAGGTGAATVPGPMAGNAAQGMTNVKLAMSTLEKALPNLPMGSDLHTAVLKALADVSKHVGDVGQQPADNTDMMQALVALARQQQSGGNPLAAMMPGGAAPPPAAAPSPAAAMM